MPLDYGNDGIFFTMGNAGFISTTVPHQTLKPSTTQPQIEKPRSARPPTEAPTPQNPDAVNIPKP